MRLDTSESGCGCVGNYNTFAWTTSGLLCFGLREACTVGVPLVFDTLQCGLVPAPSFDCIYSQLLNRSSSLLCFLRFVHSTGCKETVMSAQQFELQYQQRHVSHLILCLTAGNFHSVSKALCIHGHSLAHKLYPFISSSADSARKHNKPLRGNSHHSIVSLRRHRTYQENVQAPSPPRAQGLPHQQ
jgi:hypothetical protein